MKKYNIGIIGATGLVGAELYSILKMHNCVSKIYLTSSSHVGESFHNIYQSFNKISTEILVDTNELIINSDIIFISLPALQTQELVKSIDDSKIVIDLGSDFRLKNEEDFIKWYGSYFNDKALHEKFLYSIPEISKIKGKKRIANPGCYPTSIILALYPILKNMKIASNHIIIDSKSGVSGAGKSLIEKNLFVFVNESFMPYKVTKHRHTPEIEQELSKIAKKDIKVTFTPHLLPTTRGIESTIYVKLKNVITYQTIKEMYEKEYKQKQFIRLMSDHEYPNIRYVKGTNYCDIAFEIDERTNTLIIMSVIDNLVKGAAGQAIQNMNKVLGLKENEGLSNLVPNAI